METLALFAAVFLLEFKLSDSREGGWRKSGLAIDWVHSKLVKIPGRFERLKIPFFG